MSSFEPGTLDNIGATWTGSSDYALQPTAQRFEQYEINFAAKVWGLMGGS